MNTFKSVIVNICSKEQQNFTYWSLFFVCFQQCKKICKRSEIISNSPLLCYYYNYIVTFFNIIIEPNETGVGKK